MSGRKAFTLIELMVVIGITTVVMSVLLPGLNMVRERGRRAVCMSNLMQLSLAWIVYADENRGDLVNGKLGQDRIQPGSSPPVVLEEAWVGRMDKDWPKRRQIYGDTIDEGIRNGALWEYLRNPKVYRCPAGRVGHWVDYAIVDAMNGMPQNSTKADKVWANDRGDISRLNNKIVFIDIGRVRSSSYHVYYHQAKWGDPPPVRHRDGTTISFADAHSVYVKWKGIDTIKYGRNGNRTDRGTNPNRSPQTPEGRKDLEQMQRNVYGKLGYTPP
jgi:prepilin-type N-terminal cleavage/methylation domain-containing protein